MSVKKWVMSDEIWVMSDEWWKLSDGNWVIIFCWPNRLLVSKDSKNFLFYTLKTYFIYYIISFYNSPNVPISIFTYNSLK